MDPLVEAYLKKKQGLDQGVADARTKADWMDAGSQVGQGLADLVQPKNQVIYEKGWNETGAPKIENFSNKAADFSGIKTMGQRDLQAAQENRNQGVQDFDTEQKLTDLGTNRERDAVKFGNAQATFGLDVADKTQMMNKRKQDMAVDQEMNTPGSPGAQEFAKVVQAAVPGSPDLSKLSMARQKELTGPLFDQWKLQNKPVEVDTKAADQAALTRLKGWKLKEGYKVRPEMAEKYREAQAGANFATRVGDRLGNNIKQNGRFNPNDGQMVADSFDWLMAMKDEKALGALAGPDIGVLREIAPTIKSPGDLGALMVSNPSIAQAILSTSKNVRQKLNDRIGEAYDPETPMPADPATSGPPPGAVKKQVGSNGSVRYLDAQGKVIPQ